MDFMNRDLPRVKEIIDAMPEDPHQVNLPVITLMDELKLSMEKHLISKSNPGAQSNPNLLCIKGSNTETDTATQDPNTENDHVLNTKKHARDRNPSSISKRQAIARRKYDSYAVSVQTDLLSGRQKCIDTVTNGDSSQTEPCKNDSPLQSTDRGRAHATAIGNTPDSMQGNLEFQTTKKDKNDQGRYRLPAPMQDGERRLPLMPPPTEMNEDSSKQTHFKQNTCCRKNSQSC